MNIFTKLIRRLTGQNHIPRHGTPSILLPESRPRGWRPPGPLTPAPTPVSPPVIKDLPPGPPTFLIDSRHDAHLLSQAQRAQQRHRKALETGIPWDSTLAARQNERVVFMNGCSMGKTERSSSLSPSIWRNEDDRFPEHDQAAVPSSGSSVGMCDREWEPPSTEAYSAPAEPPAPSPSSD